MKEKIKNIISKKIVNKDRLPFIVLIGIFILIHIKMNINFGDDLVYRTQFSTPWEGMVSFYKTWASPSLLSLIQFYLVRLPDIVFKICNILMILLSAYSISKITKDKEAKYTNWIIVFFIILYPFMQMATAGWIVTSVSYIFPTAFGLYSFVYLRYILDGKKISKLNYCLFFISLILGLGQLQMACIIFGIYFVLNIFFAINKRVYKFAIFQNIIAFLFCIYHATAPGNMNRSIHETATWFSDFGMISTVNKIKLGFTSTLGNLTLSSNIFFLCFVFLLVVGVYYKYNDVLYRLISLIPLLALMIFGMFKSIFKDIFPDLVNLMNNGSNDFLQINAYNFYSKINYLTIILGVIIVGCILISMYLIFENTLKMLIVEIIFLAGFNSRMIMSFSPTIYASSTRTFIFLYFSIILCAVFIFNQISKNTTEKKQKDLLMYIGIVSAISYLQLLVML
ncbi:hypothetical protein ACTFJW_01120 [Clostridium cagae]|uniref:hypothetical protein n=1 Tax=Clostridium cagae TaxID=2080751 RepID=UPI003F762FE0